jgi:hypothetical protein
LPRSPPEPKLIKNQLSEINRAVDYDEDQDKKQDDPTGDAEIPKHIAQEAYHREQER